MSTKMQGSEFDNMEIVQMVPDMPLAPGQTHPMMSRIRQYLEVAESLEIAMVNRVNLQDKTQCTHIRPSLKKKGGKPPIDYAVAEQLADLRQAFENGHVREAIILYAQVSRALPL